MISSLATCESFPTFTFDSKILIRDLEFVDGAYRLNDCDWDSDDGDDDEYYYTPV